MSGRPSAAELLADRLALAIVECGPASGTRLAVLVAAQKAAVLGELKANPMFEQTGRARGSRWRLAGNHVQPPWEPLGTDPRAGLVSEVTPAEFDLLKRRVDELERRLADREAPTT